VAHSCGDYPDFWTDGSREFIFDCGCGAEFEVSVEWEPDFYVNKRADMADSARRD